MERYKVKTSRSTRQDWADLVPRLSRKSTKDTEEQRRRLPLSKAESGKRRTSTFAKGYGEIRPAAQAKKSGVRETEDGRSRTRASYQFRLRARLRRDKYRLFVIGGRTGPEVGSRCSVVSNKRLDLHAFAGGV